MKRMLIIGLLVMVTSLMAVSVTSAQAPCTTSPDTVGVSAPLDCTVVSGKGVGMSRALEDNIIRAVDILKASADNIVGVCLKGTGGLLFSRGDMVPRMAFWAWYYVTADGFTCTNVSAPGVVVLVSTTSPIAPGQSPDSAGTTTTTPDTATTTTTPTAPTTTTTTTTGGVTTLTNCTVVTRAILNFRDAPSLNSNVKDLIPYRSILKAIGRQGTWFNVIYGSDNGWVSASLVNVRGDCGQ